MSTRNISWGGKNGRCVGLTTFTTSMCRLSLTSGSLKLTGTFRGLSRAAMGLLFTFLYVQLRSNFPRGPYLYHFLLAALASGKWLTELSAYTRYVPQSRSADAVVSSLGLVRYIGAENSGWS
jgi:hypothetical protein